MTHVTRFTEFDIHLFKAGQHYRLYEKLGSHCMEVDGVQGVYFAVWAPNAQQVSVIGNFNFWSFSANQMKPRWDGSGIWEVFIPNIGKGEIYKYGIKTQKGTLIQKGDPFAIMWENPPKTASIVWDTWHEWKDKGWMEKRQNNMGKPQPMSVYEVHLGSWRKKDGISLSYKELATELVEYVKYMGFTHIEFMPVMEHPFFGSWGYQITGYFAPSSRFGTPQEFMELIETLHNNDIGVILDWVPSHFPEDAHGLAKFDGTALYEHEDPRLGFHPDWNSLIFNYGRFEVRSFLISNALYWLDRYHIDGLRVDAVASMLYLDYSRKAGQWIPNIYGSNENLEAIALLKEFNEMVYSEFPDAITIAEESTAWPNVSRPTFLGGLGFGQKWMMGWMHDTLSYFGRDSIYRRYHQNEITFSIVYAFTENFMLPLSHDEVVHGKGSLIGRMKGDEWQRFANLRLMFAYMFVHPGTKLLFMGSEYGQYEEWSHDRGLDWWESDKQFNNGVRLLVKALNELYKNTPALYQLAFSNEGFEWVAMDDNVNSVISFLRKGTEGEKPVLVVCNFTPSVHYHYTIGVPLGGKWKEIFNSDATEFCGSGQLNSGDINAYEHNAHGRNHAISVKLPPLGVSIIQWQGEEKVKVEKRKAKK